MAKTRQMRSDAGSIQVVDENRYRVQVESGKFPNQKRRRLSENVRGSFRDAVRVRTQLLNKLGCRTLLPQDISVQELLEDYYLPHVDKSKLHVKTKKSYHASAKNFVIPTVGHIMAGDLKRAHVRMVIEATPSHGAARNAKRVFKQAVRYGIREEVVPEGTDRIFESIKTPEPEIPYVPDILSIEEMRLLMSASRGTEYEIPLILFLTLGLRRSEATGLLWEDFDLREEVRQVTIDKSWQRNVETGELYEGPLPKNIKSVRTLVIPRTAAARLRELAKDEGPVIPGANPKIRIDPDILTGGIQRFCKAHSIKVVGPKIIRNSYGTMLAKVGITDTLAGLMMGQSKSTAGIKESTIYYKHYVITNPDLFYDPIEVVEEELFAA